MSAALRDRVIDAAAHTFAARGYHDTDLQQIASAAGIDVPDLTAEFDGKYAVFAATLLGTAEKTVRASDHIAIDAPDARRARAQIIAVLDATARGVVEHRDSSGFYRSQARHLQPHDRQRHRAFIDELQQRIRTPLAVMRPQLSDADIRVFAAAAHSCLASVTIHPTTLPAPKVLTLLTTAAMRVIDSRPAQPSDVVEHPPVAIAWQQDDSPRSRMLHRGLELFVERGFAGVTVDEVAEASGTSVEQVVAEFGSTYGIMHTACVTGFTAIRQSNTVALTIEGGPRAILAELCSSFVHHCFSDPLGMTVFLNDARYVQHDGVAELLALQTETVGHWVDILREARPELSVPEAGFLVFAGLSIVNDVGRSIAWQRDELTLARIERAVLAVLATLRN